MPHPKKGEEKQEFVSRCMGNDNMNKEFPDQKQRAAVCYSYWDKKNESINPTFKDYLVEFDRADLALQQQHKNKTQAKQDYSKTANEFKAKMDADRQAQAGNTSAAGEPQKGDVLQSPSGKQFAVLGRTNAGFRVRELGGSGKEGNLPHGRKYKQVGKTQLGKAIYKLT